MEGKKKKLFIIAGPDELGAQELASQVCGILNTQLLAHDTFALADESSTVDDAKAMLGRRNVIVATSLNKLDIVCALFADPVVLLCMDSEEMPKAKFDMRLTLGKNPDTPLYAAQLFAGKLGTSLPKGATAV